MELPFFSVIIPVWNSPGLVSRCLGALAEQDYPVDRFEVIVVDNGSTDHTIEVVTSFDFAQLIVEPISGSYRARNAGLRHARGDLVAFTDADCVPDKSWLSMAEQAMKDHPSIGVVAGHVEFFREATTVSVICESYERMFTLNQERYAHHGRCVTANWISRRALIQEFGGFKDHLRSGGDFELSGRLSAAGHRVVYDPLVVVRHPVRGKVTDILRKRARVIGGQWLTQQEVGRKTPALMGRNLVDGARAMKRILLESGLPPRVRVGLLALVVALSMTACFELLRLQLGGQPRRA